MNESLSNLMTLAIFGGLIVYAVALIMRDAKQNNQNLEGIDSLR